MIGPPKFLSGMYCAKCGKPKLIRPDNCLFCAECEKEANEQFANKIRPDLGKKGKMGINWIPAKEE